MSGTRVLPGLGLTAFWPYKSDNWNTEMDANLVLLSAMAGRVTVESRFTAVADMDKTKVYLVPSNAGSNPNAIAIWNNDPQVGDQAWIYITPKAGWTAFIVNEAVAVDFLYGAWAPSQFSFSKAYMESGYDQRWLADITLESGFAQTASMQTTRYRKALTFVDLDLEVTTAGATTDGTTVTTLPAGHRPPLAIYLPVASAVAGSRALIGADGTVKAYGFTAAGAYSLHAHFSLL